MKRKYSRLYSNTTIFKKKNGHIFKSLQCIYYEMIIYFNYGEHALLFMNSGVRKQTISRNVK